MKKVSERFLEHFLAALPEHFDKSKWSTNRLLGTAIGDALEKTLKVELHPTPDNLAREIAPDSAGG